MKASGCEKAAAAVSRAVLKTSERCIEAEMRNRVETAKLHMYYKLMEKQRVKSGFQIQKEKRQAAYAMRSMMKTSGASEASVESDERYILNRESSPHFERGTHMNAKVLRRWRTTENHIQRSLLPHQRQTVSIETHNTLRETVTTLALDDDKVKMKSVDKSHNKVRDFRCLSSLSCPMPVIDVFECLRDVSEESQNEKSIQVRPKTAPARGSLKTSSNRHRLQNGVILTAREPEPFSADDWEKQMVKKYIGVISKPPEKISRPAFVRCKSAAELRRKYGSDKEEAGSIPTHPERRPKSAWGMLEAQTPVSKTVDGVSTAAHRRKRDIPLDHRYRPHTSGGHVRSVVSGDTHNTYRGRPKSACASTHKGKQRKGNNKKSPAVIKGLCNARSQIDNDLCDNSKDSETLDEIDIIRAANQVYQTDSRCESHMSDISKDKADPRSDSVEENENVEEEGKKDKNTENVNVEQQDCDISIKGETMKGATYSKTGEADTPHSAQNLLEKDGKFYSKQVSLKSIAQVIMHSLAKDKEHRGRPKHLGNHKGMQTAKKVRSKLADEHIAQHTNNSKTNGCVNRVFLAAHKCGIYERKVRERIGIRDYDNGNDADLERTKPKIKTEKAPFDSAITDEDINDDANDDDETEVVDVKGRLPRWQRDLMKEAPPSLNAIREPIKFNLALSRTERQRELTKLVDENFFDAAAIMNRERSRKLEARVRLFLAAQKIRQIAAMKRKEKE